MGTIELIPSISAVKTSGPSSIADLAGWADFSDIATLWQAANLTSAITTDGQMIKSVTDKSGNNKTYQDSANGPAYKVNRQNSLSAALFDGVNDTLGVLGWSMSQPYTVLLVAKIVVDEPASNTLLLDGGVARAILYKDQATGKWSYYAGTLQVGSVAADTSYHVHDAVFNGASSSYQVDAVTTSSANPGTNALSQPLIARDPFTGFFNIEVGEILHYSRALTSGERSTLDAYLKAKWGTP